MRVLTGHHKHFIPRALKRMFELVSPDTADQLGAKVTASHKDYTFSRRSFKPYIVLMATGSYARTILGPILTRSPYLPMSLI